jgi:uncharacterized membrane protein YcjF (UPF0283 family)
MKQDHSSRSLLGNPMGDHGPAETGKKDAECPNKQADAETIVRRDGDFGLGVPELAVPDYRPLSAKETEAHRHAVEEELRRKAEAMLADLEHSEGWRLPAPIRRACSVALLGAAALMGLFIISQSVQFVADIRAMPEWSQWLATGGLILFSGILAIIMASLLWSIVRLQRSPRIHLKSMKVLAERQQMQRFALEKEAGAKTMLEDYLRGYPATAKDRKRLLGIGMSEDEWAAMQSARNLLLDSSRPLGLSDWLDDFRNRFQAILDEVAKRRVNQYARRVGVGTAASPMAMVDQLIVLYGSTAMVKDLFRIYHLRPALGQTALILSRGIVHTYLSGMIEEATETVAETASDSLAGMAGEGAGVLAGTLGKAIGAKGAEATLNMLLIWRLGKSSMKLLQPVRD